jgi:hypothetical protein
VAYLLKSRTVEPEEQPLLGNAARNNRGTVLIRDVTRTAVAMEQLSKHISVEKNSRNNRRSVFSAWSVPRVYTRKKDEEDRLVS